MATNLEYYDPRKDEEPVYNPSYASPPSQDEGPMDWRVNPVSGQVELLALSKLTLMQIGGRIERRTQTN